MRQVVQRRKRGAVGQSGCGLDDTGLTVGASVGDGEYPTRLAAELPCHRVEVGGINHRERVPRGEAPAGGGARRVGGRRRNRRPAAVRAGYRRSSSTARCTTGRCSRRWPAAPGPGGYDRPRGQLHLVGNVAGHHEAQPFPGLRGDVHRIAQLDLLPLEIGDLGPQRGLGGGQLVHLRALCEVRPDRTGDGQRQHAHHRGQDGGTPRGEPQPLFGLLFGGVRERLLDRNERPGLGRDLRTGVPRLRRPRLAARGGR